MRTLTPHARRAQPLRPALLSARRVRLAPWMCAAAALAALSPHTTLGATSAETVATTGAAIGALAAAPAQDQPSSDAGWWATVTTNDVYVRSAPSVDSAYPFLKLDRDAMVKVLEEDVGWARIAAVGPAFKGAFGYVRADRRVKPSADGLVAEIVSRVDVLAPNLTARFNPDSSWKPIAKLEPGQTVAILDTISGQRDTVHKIALPPTAEGWVNLTFLRRATAEEIASLDPALTGRTPAPVRIPEDPDTSPAGGDPARGDGAPPAAPSGREPASPTPSAPAAPADGARGTIEVLPPEPDEEVEAEVEVLEVEVDAAPPAADDQAIVTGDAGRSGVEAEIERITLDDLEAAFELLKAEDPETAEVGVLRVRYLEFAERASVSPAQREFALVRAKQLQTKEEVQERLARVRELRAKARADLEIIRGSRIAMDSRQPYAAVGRLNASTVYDGVRLPLLFRVQDPGGGQSIAYLQPGQGFDLTALLGQLVGIVGTKRYDEALRLNIIEPTRIDVLTTER